MNCADVEELRDLYVLGALPSDEAEAVEEHVGTCAECTQRIEESWRAARLLRSVVGAAEPRAGVRTQVLEAAGLPPLPPGEGAERARPARSEPGAFRASAPAEARPPLWGFWRTARWAAAAAVLPLLVSGWLAAQVLALQSQVQSNQRALEQSWQSAQHAAEVMGKAIERGGAKISLVATEKAPTASGALYYMPTDQEGVLVVAGLPPLTRGQVYQVWLLSDADSVPGPTFYLEDDGRGMVVVKSPTPLTTMQGLRITNEPHGGSATPHGDRYLWGTMGRAQPS